MLAAFGAGGLTINYTQNQTIHPLFETGYPRSKTSVHNVTTIRTVSASQFRQTHKHTLRRTHTTHKHLYIRHGIKNWQVESVKHFHFAPHVINNEFRLQMEKHMKLMR